MADVFFGVYVGSSDSRPPTGCDEVPPRASEVGHVSTSDLPPPGHDGVPRPQAHEGAPESPKLGEEGDPITISGESGDGPRSTGD